MILNNFLWCRIYYVNRGFLACIIHNFSHWYYSSYVLWILNIQDYRRLLDRLRALSGLLDHHPLKSIKLYKCSFCSFFTYKFNFWKFIIYKYKNMYLQRYFGDGQTKTTITTKLYNKKKRIRNIKTFTTKYTFTWSSLWIPSWKGVLPHSP